MGFTDFLFQGSPPPATASSVESQPNLPDWYQEYLRGLIARSSAIAGEPYQPYGGNRLAAPTADQTKAYDAVRSNVGAWKPQLNQAGALTKASSTWDPNQRQDFMSPYIGGVLDEIARRGQRNLTESLLPNVNTTFTGAGQFGSTRHGDFTQRALRDTQESILGQQATSLQAGYEQAGKEYADWAQRGLVGADQMAQLAKQRQDMAGVDATALEAVGLTLQQQNQSGLDIAYQNFLQQRDYPKTQAGFMSDIIRGMQIPQGTYQYSVTPRGGPGPSPLTQIAGLYDAYKGITS